jgi:hypothetical protein
MSFDRPSTRSVYKSLELGSPNFHINLHRALSSKWRLKVTLEGNYTIFMRQRAEILLGPLPQFPSQPVTITPPDQGSNTSRIRGVFRIVEEILSRHDYINPPDVYELWNELHNCAEYFYCFPREIKLNWAQPNKLFFYFVY